MRIFKIIWYLAFIYFTYSKCVHDIFSETSQKYFYNDFQGRILQASTVGKIRIFADYSQVIIGGNTDINIIKRITNITASYFYNLLKVTRLQKLYFPSNVSLKCNTLTISDKYVTEGIIGDFGIIVGNQDSSSAIYVAKSSACAFLQSTKRPIWGMIQFNNAYLKYDQQGFQQILFVGIHEMTHLLGFSASMYEFFPNGNPLKSYQNGDNYLASDLINSEVQKHFGCKNGKGLPLEDQDGTLISSHWERKVIGSEYMGASNKKGSFISRFTLALLQSTGWYYDVNYNLAQKTTWGKDQGCDFLNIDNCGFDEFCTTSDFACDWESSAIGKCNQDSFTGSCKVIKYYTNTICIDENYQLKNLNSKLNANQRGGSNSKCFASNFRQAGLQQTLLNNRCYNSICSFTGKYIFILVGSYILVCRIPGQQIQAPLGMLGTLICPKSFQNVCQNKQFCPYHCNKNGICIDGQCLCTGQTSFSTSCLDLSIYELPIGLTGGLINSMKQSNQELSLNGQTLFESKLMQNNQIIQKKSINKKCFTGYVFDKTFGQCLSCKDAFNCQNCDERGCIFCDNGQMPIQGFCKL